MEFEGFDEGVEMSLSLMIEGWNGMGWRWGGRWRMREITVLYEKVYSRRGNGVRFVWSNPMMRKERGL
jgi:hypothetical protein